MAAITDIDTFDIVPALGVKKVLIQPRNTVDAADTIAITLSDHGIGELIGVLAWVHTTDGSVITTEAVTTSVTSGVVTITIPAGTDNDTRVIELTGYSGSGTFT